MNKVYTSAVVIIPPKEKWGPIQEIRKLYDRNIYRWMPHITLLFPFYPKNQYTEIEKNFLLVSSEFTMFEICLREFRSFKHYNKNYTIWLDPTPNDMIINLQSEFLKITPECNDVNKFKGGYSPHLSIGQFKGNHISLKNKIDELQNSWKEITFEVKEFYFIWCDNIKNSRFQIEKRFLLSKSP